MSEMSSLEIEHIIPVEAKITARPQLSMDKFPPYKLRLTWHFTDFRKGDPGEVERALHI